MNKELVVSVSYSDLDLICPDSPSEGDRTTNVLNRFPPISPSGSSIFTPCAIPEEENRPRPISSLTKLINDSNNNTPSTTNSNSANNSLHEFPALYSQLNSVGVLSCDMLLKKAMNELVDTNCDENLSLFPAENDGAIMDDLPEFSRSSDITVCGITHFIVVDKSTSKHLLHYKIEKIVDNKKKLNSSDNYTISCMGPPNNKSSCQELKNDSSVSNKHQTYSVDYFNNRSIFLNTNSPTRSIVNSPTNLNEENEIYESDIVHEVNSNDSFSDTWVDSGVKLTT